MSSEKLSVAAGDVLESIKKFGCEEKTTYRTYASTKKLKHDCTEFLLTPPDGSKLVPLNKTTFRENQKIIVRLYPKSFKK